MEKTKHAGETQVIFRDDNILYFIMGGKPDHDMAINIKNIALDFINKSENKISFLIDINKVGQPSSDARKIFRDMQELDKVKKTALFGAHPVAKILASVVISISRKGNQRFFDTKEDALKWLNEE